MIYVSNYTHKTEFAFDAKRGTQLWSVPLPDVGDVGTVIANGMVYVSSKDGTITAWAPPQEQKTEKALPKRAVIVLVRDA